MCAAFNGAAIVDKAPQPVFVRRVVSKNRFKMEVAILTNDVNRIMKDLVRGRYGREQINDPTCRVKLVHLSCDGDRKPDALMKKTKPTQVTHEESSVIRLSL